MVGIGFISAIWLIGLTVEENPVNRVFVTLSKERTLPELHSIDDGDLAFGLVATEEGQPSAASSAHPATPYLLRIPD